MPTPAASIEWPTSRPPGSISSLCHQVELSSRPSGPRRRTDQPNQPPDWRAAGVADEEATSQDWLPTDRRSPQCHMPIVPARSICRRAASDWQQQQDDVGLQQEIYVQSTARPTVSQAPLTGDSIKHSDQTTQTESDHYPCTMPNSKQTYWIQLNLMEFDYNDMTDLLTPSMNVLYVTEPQ